MLPDRGARRGHQEERCERADDDRDRRSRTGPHRDDGAREGAAFIADHIIRVSESNFDDFIDQGADRTAVDRALGLGDR